MRIKHPIATAEVAAANAQTVAGPERKPTAESIDKRVRQMAVPAPDIKGTHALTSVCSATQAIVRRYENVTPAPRINDF